MSNETNTEGTIEMSNTNTDKTDNDLTVEQWLQVRKDAALLIDAETAEVSWIHGYGIDPYGVFSDLSWEEQVIGRNYFARQPGSDIWVSFSDLPNDTYNKLWEMHKHKLALNVGALLESMQKWNDPTAEKTAACPATPKKRTD
jgi:hypothetical protein